MLVARQHISKMATFSPSLLRVPQKEVSKRCSITYLFHFWSLVGHLSDGSVTFLVTFCQTPFAGLLLRQRELPLAFPISQILSHHVLNLSYRSPRFGGHPGFVPIAKECPQYCRKVCQNDLIPSWILACTRSKWTILAFGSANCTLASPEFPCFPPICDPCFQECFFRFVPICIFSEQSGQVRTNQVNPFLPAPLASPRP